MKANIPWHRYSLIIYLTRKLQDKSPQLGKTALQKFIFLLQELEGVNCGYDFILYNYGPYDPQIQIDLSVVKNLKGVIVKDSFFGLGYEITPGPKAEDIRKKGQSFLDSFSKQIDHIVDIFGNYPAKFLGLIAIIIYVLKENSKVIDLKYLKKTIKEIKPHFSWKDIEEAILVLEKNGFIEIKNGQVFLKK